MELSVKVNLPRSVQKKYCFKIKKNALRISGPGINPVKSYIEFCKCLEPTVGSLARRLTHLSPGPEIPSNSETNLKADAHEVKNLTGLTFRKIILLYSESFVLTVDSNFRLHKI